MNFQYYGRNMSGQKVRGKIDADTRKAALNELEHKGLIVIDLAETKPWNKDITLSRKINNKEFVIFLRQYATLIHAGISISASTKTMINQIQNRNLKDALIDIDKQLEQGQALSVAVARHPKVFPELLVNMITAGEASGKLDEILNEMADYYEKEFRNRQRIISALTYPTVVGIVTLLLSIFLLVYIVPKFVGMYHSFGEEIPPYTRLVLNLSEWVSSFWWTLAIIIFIVVVLYKYFLQNDRFSYRMDKAKMTFPVLGILVHKSALVRLTRTLSTLVNSSVPILQSVEITEKVVGNRVIRAILEDSRSSLELGESLTKPMMGHWAFPPMVVQMMQVGEKTGALDQMLLKAAEFYEEEVEQLSSRIKTLIEPLMIIILTVLVGGIITAVVIPMFSLFENIQ